MHEKEEKEEEEDEEVARELKWLQVPQGTWNHFLFSSRYQWQDRLRPAGGRRPNLEASCGQ